MSESRWQDIFLHLKKKEIDVYSPSTKTGECHEPYVVLVDSGETKLFGFSSVQQFYALLCYVPQREYSSLEPYVRKVEEIMNGLRPMIMPTNTKSASFYDNDIKAHMVSIQYRNNRKL